MKLRTAAAVLKALARPSRSVVEVRCIGDNFGDIMVAEAIEALFSDLTILSPSPGAVRRLDRIVGLRRLARFCGLGGGTLIFASHYSPWLADLRYCMTRSEPLFTAGTGVVDPAFREHLHELRPGRPSTLSRVIDEWTDCLRRIPFVTVRGIESQRILAEHGLTDVEVVGDPALFYARDVIRPRRHQKRIGINVSTYSQFWGDSQESTVEEMSRLMRWLRGDGWTIELFPTMAEDHDLARRLVASDGAAGGVSIWPHHRSIRGFLDRVEAQDVFVGVKLHSVIAACCVYTPAVMIGYQPKCHDFMATMGLERFAVRADRLDADRVMAMVRDLHADGPTVQDEQYRSAQALRRSLLDFRSRVVRYALEERGATTTASD